MLFSCKQHNQQLSETAFWLHNVWHLQYTFSLHYAKFHYHSIFWNLCFNSSILPPYLLSLQEIHMLTTKQFSSLFITEPIVLHVLSLVHMSPLKLWNSLQYFSNFTGILYFILPTQCNTRKHENHIISVDKCYVTSYIFYTRIIFLNSILLTVKGVSIYV